MSSEDPYDSSAGGGRAAAPCPGVPPRVLLAEDDGALRSMLHDALRTAGFEVALAEDGRKALDLIREGGAYDLLLLDDEMPGFTGRRLLALLRGEGVSTSALLHTGNPEIQPEEVARLGASLLRKPSTLRTLVAAARSAIGDAPGG